MGCPEPHTPGHAQSSYPSASQACAQSKDQEGLCSHLGGPTGTLLFSQACLAHGPVVRGDQGACVCSAPQAHETCAGFGFQRAAEQPSS